MADIKFQPAEALTIKTIVLQGANGAANLKPEIVLSGLLNLEKFEVETDYGIEAMPSLSANTKLEDFRLSGNSSLSGSIPSLSNNTSLVRFKSNFNNLTGGIPSLSNNTNLYAFESFNNNLTGSIPSLSNNTNLYAFTVNNNTLSGSIPSLSNNTNLYAFTVNNNNLSGSIPDLSTNTALTKFHCQNNNLVSSNISAVSSTLTNFSAAGNTLSESAINDILAAFAAAGHSNGFLNLGGAGNAAPTGQGITDTETLRSNGWTVHLGTGTGLTNTVLNPPESKRSYSSVYNNDAPGTGHARSMLDSSQAWSYSNTIGTGDQWMQIDLDVNKTISGVVTQGRYNYSQYVTSYKVEHSSDGTNWSWVDNENVFTGNTDANTKITNSFTTNVVARYIRIYPETYVSYPSMRAGVVETTN
jgi:hypothetical protein